MLPAELFQKVHIRFEKNTDYPAPTSEDFIVRREYLDDMITMWEKEVREGVYWDILKKTASFSASGTGTDSLATNVPDFLSFIRPDGFQAVLTAGTTEWKEVSMDEGNRLAQQGTNAYAFWIEGGTIRTLPALTGTMVFPYIREATRYPLGTETTPLEVADEHFYMEGMLAMLYLDDGNLNQYQAHMNTAVDLLDSMRFKTLMTPVADSAWGLGM